MSMHPEIDKVLDEEVRPVLAAHGGDIGWYEFRDGEFRFRFTGGYALCPSAWITAEQVVAAALMPRFPQVNKVVMEQQVGSALLSQARAMMKGRHS